MNLSEEPERRIPLRRSLATIERVFSDSTPVGLPWQTVTACLHVLTNPTLPGQRFTPEEASQIVNH